MTSRAVHGRARPYALPTPLLLSTWTARSARQPCLTVVMALIMHCAVIIVVVVIVIRARFASEAPTAAADKILNPGLQVSAINRQRLSCHIRTLLLFLGARTCCVWVLKSRRLIKKTLNVFPTANLGQSTMASSKTVMSFTTDSRK